MGEIKYGYTIADLDVMARAACMADRTMASDMDTRYGVAWSAIALALVEAPHWPRREWLVQVGWQAIYAEIRAMRHTLGMSRQADDRDVSVPMAAGPRAQAYWYAPVTSFEEGLTERLSVGPVMATLTDAERAAVTALAVHDDYRAAADSLGVSYRALTTRLSAARRRFYRRWFYPETAPGVWGTDRRVESYARPRSTHCGNGHEWTPESTRLRKSRRERTCRICEAARRRLVG